MKRTISALLLAVFLSILYIPCGARDAEVPKSRAYTGFADVAEDSWCYDAVKLCYEAGLLNGTSDTAFSPNAPLTYAQLTVLSARLHHILKGGDGVLPTLPADADDYVRFYDGDGKQVGNLSDVEGNSWFFDGHYLSVSFREDFTPPFPLRVEIGFPDSGFHYEAASWVLPELGGGLWIVEEADMRELASHLNGYMWSCQAAREAGAWDQWWFPASYYLDYRENIDLLTTPHMESPDFDGSAWREDFAALLWSVCGDLPVLNQDPAIPDVPGKRYDYQQTAAIRSLYRAGILNGADALGSFRGTASLTRAQAAVMLARVLHPALRIGACNSEL